MINCQLTSFVTEASLRGNGQAATATPVLRSESAEMSDHHKMNLLPECIQTVGLH